MFCCQQQQKQQKATVIVPMVTVYVGNQTCASVQQLKPFACPLCRLLIPVYKWAALYLVRTPASATTPKPDPSCQLWVLRVSDVILYNVASQPVYAHDKDQPHMSIPLAP